ncbi:MAG: zinc ABC transporter substrate-binding protein [Anaerolineae bacterium]|nr:zinc ABC transporter substrate-binding protein [Anaerolineae bacterium]
MNNRHFFWLISLLLAVPWLIMGCGRQMNNPAAAQATENEPATVPDAAARQDGLFRIVTTTTQATDLTKILTQGVSDLEITPLMGAGVDPHLYQPTEADIAAMNRADMVIYSGLHLEGQFDAVFAALREQGVRVYSLGQPVKEAGFIIGAFEATGALLGADDPHFWFDPRNWEVTTLDLAAALAAMDPDNGEVYEGNAAAYTAQLQLLYTWANEGMRTVPEGQRYLVTSHDAFQYFGAAFGWRMAAIQGISTEAEAGVGDIQGTVNFVIDNQIPVLFVESSISPNTIQAVQSAIAARGGQVRLGVRELYSDAMGEPGTFGGTYIGMIAANVLTILQSYQCAGVAVTIPAWPASLTPVPPVQMSSVTC